mgnify:CR=1 FL=1
MVSEAASSESKSLSMKRFRVPSAANCAGDPCTNPNFDIQREDFALKILPLE